MRPSSVDMPEFLDELAVFYGEQSGCQRSLFAYLALRSRILDDSDARRALQAHPLFWATAMDASMALFFISIARIFDHKPTSHHTIYTLLNSLEANLGDFSRASFRDRKMQGGFNAEIAGDHASRAYELTLRDVSDLRKIVGMWKTIYDRRYRDVRDVVYAHNRSRDVMRERLAKTDFDEMRDIAAFMAGLHNDLWQLWHNGTRPRMALYDFKMPADAGVFMTDGEVAYNEANAVVDAVTGALSKD